MGDFTQHWVKTIEAQRHDYKHAALRLSLGVGHADLPAEITLFLDDDELTTALVGAINETVASHKARKSAQPPDDTASDDGQPTEVQEWHDFDAAC